MLKFTERPKTLGMTSKQNVAFPEGNKLFAGDFVLIWMKETLIWFNLQRDGTINGLSNIKETFAESLQLQMTVLHQRMSIFQSSMLVSQVHIMAANILTTQQYSICFVHRTLKQYMITETFGFIPSVCCD